MRLDYLDLRHMSLKEVIDRNLPLFDGDLDGRLTTEELCAFIRSMGVGLTNQEEEDLVAQGHSSNGFVDWNQAKTIAEKYAEGKPRDWLRTSLKKFDRKKQGTINSDELRAALDNLGQLLNTAQKEEFLALCDPEKAGTVNIDNLLKKFGLP